MNIEGKPGSPGLLPKGTRPGSRFRGAAGPIVTSFSEQKGKSPGLQLLKIAIAPSPLLFLHFALLSLFIGQLSPFPLFWGLLMLFSVAEFLALLQVVKGINVRAWLWLLPLTILLVKLLFYPGVDWGDTSWLRSFAWGFADLFPSPFLILQPEMLREVTQSLAPSASLFIVLSCLTWFPVFLSVERSILHNAWGWPLLLTVFFLVWLEPLPVSSVFFFPLLLLISGFFLLMVHRKRYERWREKRFAYRSSDLRRSFRWSLLILLPLLLFILPWSLGRLSLSSVNFPSIPSFPSLTAASPSPGASPALPSTAIPGVALPPIELPGWVQNMAYISSLVIIFLVFILFAYLFFRLGKLESIGYLILISVFFVLALWLLPPYLGPLLAGLFYYLSLAWKHVLGVLGFASSSPTQGGPLPPSASGGEGSSSAFLDFVRSTLAFFTQSILWIIVFSAFLLLLASYFIWRFLLRDLRKRRLERRMIQEAYVAAEKEEGTILAFYRQLLQLLEALGVKRKPVETPWEYARRAEPSVPEIVFELKDLTGAFVEARYAWRHPSPERLLSLERELSQVREAVLRARIEDRDRRERATT